MLLRSIHENSDGSVIFQVSITAPELSESDLLGFADDGTLFSRVRLSVTSEALIPAFRAVQQRGAAYSLAFTSDDAYFSSYGDRSVHRLMLSDRPRVRFYEEMLSQAARGARVLDVGAGSGVLSLLAARHGAAFVCACEAAPVAAKLPAVLGANIQYCPFAVHAARVEELAEAAHGRFDVIVSEWMGFHLLHEGMLDAVLDARDRLLAPGGRLLPSRARILAAGVQTRFWRRRHYGFDFSAFLRTAEDVHDDAKEEEEEEGGEWTLRTDRWLDALPAGAEAAVLADFDLERMTPRDADRLGAEVRVAADADAVALWFEVEGAGARLSTGPDGEDTHWKQTLVRVPGEGVRVVRVELAREADDPRKYEVSLQFQ